MTLTELSIPKDSPTSFIKEKQSLISLNTEEPIFYSKSIFITNTAHERKWWRKWFLHTWV